MAKKSITKKDVEKICHNMVFSKSVRHLAKIIKKAQAIPSQKKINIEVNAALTNLDMELSTLSYKLDEMMEKVLLHDFMIGRVNKSQLIEQFKSLLDGDILSVTEKLEQFQIEKDKFDGRVRDADNAMLCSHANENPLLCPCPTYCYCKRHTCVNK